jgi:hypothetical protein
VSLNEILNGRLHIIYIINIDDGQVKEMDVDQYFEEILNLISIPNSIIHDQ